MTGETFGVVVMVPDEAGDAELEVLRKEIVEWWRDALPRGWRGAWTDPTVTLIDAATVLTADGETLQVAEYSHPVTGEPMRLPRRVLRAVGGAVRDA